MRNKNAGIKLLFNIMPSEEWHNEILDRLNLNPLSFDDLSKKFGFIKDDTEYKELMILVSELQEGSRKMTPKIRTAFTDNIHVFPLYRVDQEKFFVKMGILSKEVVTNPIELKHEFGKER